VLHSSFSTYIAAITLASIAKFSVAHLALRQLASVKPSHRN
jgi:hypothetical protein